MADETPPPEQLNPPPVVDMKHAGSFSIGVDPANVHIVFSRPLLQFTGVGLTGQAVLIPSVGVVMSPQLAKNLARRLADSITQYEKEFGHVPDMPG